MKNLLIMSKNDNADVMRNTHTSKCQALVSPNNSHVVFQNLLLILTFDQQGQIQGETLL